MQSAHPTSGSAARVNRARRSSRRTSSGRQRNAKQRFDTRSSGRSEPLTERGVVEEARERSGELLGITRRDEQSRLSVDHELRQPSHTGRHDRKAGRHGFQNRNGRGFRSARENENVGGGKNLRDVLALSGEVDGSGQPESPKLGLDRRPIGSVAHDERLKRPSTQLRESVNELRISARRALRRAGVHRAARRALHRMRR